jgi:hypothetical protein
VNGGNYIPGVSQFVDSPNVTTVNVSKPCNITERGIEHVHKLQPDLRRGARTTLTSILTKHDVRVWSGLTLQISDMCEYSDESSG